MTAVSSTKDVSILNLSDGDMSSVHTWPSSSITSILSSAPLTKVISVRNRELMAFSNSSFFRQDDFSKVNVDWGNSLDDLACIGAYYIGLTSSRTIQIKLGHSFVVQNFELPSPIKPPLIAVENLLIFFSASQIYTLTLVPPHKLINSLVAQNQFEEAISIVELIEVPNDEKLSMKRHIQLSKAHALFQNKKFDEAMEIFRNQGSSPENVLRYFAFLKFEISEFSEIRVPPSPNSPTPVSPPSPPGSHQAQSPPSSPTGKTKFTIPEEGEITGNKQTDMSRFDVPEAKRALGRFLTERRSILNRLRSNGHNAAEIVPASIITTDGNQQQQNGRINSLITSSGVMASSSSFNSQAGDTLQMLSNALTPEEIDKQAAIVDTALLLLYLHNKSDSMLGSLLRVKNACHVDSTVKVLLEHQVSYFICKFTKLYVGILTSALHSLENSRAGGLLLLQRTP
jgi:hypothetical protein